MKRISAAMSVLTAAIVIAGIIFRPADLSAVIFSEQPNEAATAEVPENAGNAEVVAETLARDPETILPDASFLVFHEDGSQKHQPAIAETAAWKSLVDSQLRARMFDLFSLTADRELGIKVRELWEHILTHGVSIAASLSADQASLSPYAVMVLPEAAAQHSFINEIAEGIAAESRLPVQQMEIQGRHVSTVVTNVPGIEVSWWLEGPHMVVAAGMFASRQVMDTIEGRAWSLQQNARWKKLRTSEKYAVHRFAWLDSGQLISRLGELAMPDGFCEKRVTVREFLTVLGLQNLVGISSQSGFSGAETWQYSGIEIDGNASGILAVLQQEPLRLEDLPPLPVKVSGFAAASIDVAGSLEHAYQTAFRVAEICGHRKKESLEEGLAQLNEAWGSDLKADLSAALGNVWCIYGDTASLPIPIGASPAIAVRIKDRDLLLRVVDRCTELIRQNADDERLSIRRTEKDGNVYVSIGIPPAPLFPTLLVTQNWLVLGVTPGTAQSFVQREKGRAPVWKPDSRIDEAFKELPETFTSITVSDPAPGYEQILSFAPMALEMFARQFVSGMSGEPAELPFKIEDIPDVDTVTSAMFPNVSIGQNGAHGWEFWSRESVPSGPLGIVGATTAAPVLVALLLPAVQQARDAARRTQGRNQLSTLGLAMHEHHDQWESFPSATVNNDQLPPDRRLSWVLPLLPYLNQNEIVEQLRDHMDDEWDSEPFAAARQTVVPALQNPEMSRENAAPSSMDYVGISGYGDDSANLRERGGRTGIFNYHFETRMRDITDGTSNTLMIGEASAPNRSWLAGGSETVRGFSRKPYLNGPDAVGLPRNGEVLLLLSDGSVRAMSMETDDHILESLSTKAGGESSGDF